MWAAAAVDDRIIDLGSLALPAPESLDAYVEYTLDAARGALANAGKFQEAREAHPFILEPAAFCVLVHCHDAAEDLQARVSTLETQLQQTREYLADLIAELELSRLGIDPPPIPTTTPAQGE